MRTCSARAARVLSFELGPRSNAELESLGLSNPADVVMVRDGAWPAFRAWRLGGGVENVVATVLKQGGRDTACVSRRTCAWRGAGGRVSMVRATN